ncbi:hypothetical protein ACWCSH_35690, partial [Streptosporangium sp. NPDC001682]
PPGEGARVDSGYALGNTVTPYGSGGDPHGGASVDDLVIALARGTVPCPGSRLGEPGPESQ